MWTKPTRAKQEKVETHRGSRGKGCDNPRRRPSIRLDELGPTRANPHPGAKHLVVTM